MWLFAGLGNPGDQYAGNRHNIGFMAADAIAARHRFPAFKSKFDGHISQGEIAGEKVLLLKPQTYMNESGVSVQKATSFYKIAPERIVVFYDELDLPPGKVRVKKGGGSGGHNGIKSIDTHLSSQEYWRVRLGIGHPGHKDRVSGYVLSDFPKNDREWVAQWMQVLAQEVPLLAHGKMSDFMTKIARTFSPPGNEILSDDPA